MARTEHVENSFLPSSTEGKVWLVQTRVTKRHVVSIAREGILDVTFTHKLFTDRELQLKTTKYFQADMEAAKNFHAIAVQIMQSKHAEKLKQ